jgi:hypothetical protein
MGEVRHHHIPSFFQSLICSQEQLIDVFKSVGQVVGFRCVCICPTVSLILLTPSRLVFDRETGKPRGYGFCEFAGIRVSPLPPTSLDSGILISFPKTMKPLSQPLETSITSMSAAGPSESILLTRILFLRVRQRCAESSLMVAKHGRSGANVRMLKEKGIRSRIVPRTEHRFSAIFLKVSLFP